MNLEVFTADFIPNYKYNLIVTGNCESFDRLRNATLGHFRSNYINKQLSLLRNNSQNLNTFQEKAIHANL